MARYRTYKNGITGHRYKGYYIIRGASKGMFEIWNKDKTVLKDHIHDFEECEWIIDKLTADEETINIVRQLYDKEIYQLSSLLVDLMQKKEKKDFDENLYKWVEKVRRRKVNERLF